MYGLSNDDNSERFIAVTNVSYLQETTKALASKKCSYIILYSKQILQEYNDWKIIAQNKFDDDYYIALMSKVKCIIFPIQLILINPVGRT